MVAAALRQPEWLGSFKGKTATNRWHLGEDLPLPDRQALASAQAIVEGVRALLVLRSTVERFPTPAAPIAHH